MKFTPSAFAALLVAAVSISCSEAFAPPQPVIRASATAPTSRLHSSSGDDSNAKKSPSLPNLPKFDGSIFNDVTESLTELASVNPQNIKDNVMDGTFGSRGEIYFFGQATLILSILLGGIPIVQPFLSIVLGPGLLIAGLAIAGAALVDMGGALSPWVKPPTTASARLVTNGLFMYMRHPMYAGLIASLTGISILSGSADRLLLTGLLFVFLDFKSSKEEEEMVILYGDEYETYMRRVPTKFFPQGILTEN